MSADKDDIRAIVSMPEVLTLFGFEPDRHGKLCCPFHIEKTPSMKIYDDGFYCYGCGVGGSIFDFVMKLENLDFPAALDLICEAFGIENDNGKPDYNYQEYKKFAEWKELELDRVMQGCFVKIVNHEEITVDIIYHDKLLHDGFALSRYPNKNKLNTGTVAFYRKRVSDRQKPAIEREKRKAYAWYVWNRLAAYRGYLLGLQGYAPERFHNIEYLEYIFDEFIGDFDGLVDFLPDVDSWLKSRHAKYSNMKP